MESGGAATRSLGAGSSMCSFVQTTLSERLESDGDGIGGNEQEAEQIGAGNSRRAFPFPNFGVFYKAFLSSTSVPGGCA